MLVEPGAGCAYGVVITPCTPSACRAGACDGGSGGLPGPWLGAARLTNAGGRSRRPGGRRALARARGVRSCPGGASSLLSLSRRFPACESTQGPAPRTCNSWRKASSICASGFLRLPAIQPITSFDLARAPERRRRPLGRPRVKLLCGQSLAGAPPNEGLSRAERSVNAELAPGCAERADVGVERH